MFIDREMTKKHSFKITKLERLLKIKNMNETENNGGNITYQIKVNVFYKSHVERIRINICNLKKTEVILEMP